MSITILYGTQTIGYSAFSYCSSLQSVALPGSVTSIGEFAFARCSSLSSITIPNSVTSIGGFVFMDCSGLTSIYCYAQQPPTLGTKVFGGVNKTIPLYVLANSVSLYSAAAQWNEFTNIVGVSDGFCGDSLTWTLQNHVLTISGTGAMTDYVRFDSVPWYVYRDSIYTVVIDSGVTTIGDFAFENNRNLTSITVPDGITSIGKCAFAGSGLTSFSLPLSITAIGDSICYSCANLSSVTLHNGVISIGDFTYSQCPSLTSITIPSSVTSIGKGAFYACSGIESVTCYAPIPPALGARVFAGIDIVSAPLYVPQNSVSLYSTAEQWKDFFEIVGIEDALHPIDASATQARMTFIDGHLYLLLPNGTRYDATGKKVE